MQPLRLADVDSSPPLVESQTSDDDTRCVVSPRVPGVASVISLSLQLSPAELIGAGTVKARHNVPAPCHTMLLSPLVLATPVQIAHQAKIKLSDVCSEIHTLMT